MRRLRLGILALCLVGIVLLAGCVTSGQDLKSMASLGPDEIVVAGKIMLDPPLDKSEQTLGLTGEYMRNVVYFHLGENMLSLEQVGPGNANEMYSSKLGEPFFLSIKRAALFYYSAPFVQLAVANNGRMILPGGLRYSVPQGARAVSIGTIVYHRDEYNEIKKVDLSVGDPSIRDAFVSRFGSQVELAVVKPVKEK